MGNLRRPHAVGGCAPARWGTGGTPVSIWRSLFCVQNTPFVPNGGHSMDFGPKDSVVLIRNVEREPGLAPCEPLMTINGQCSHGFSTTLADGQRAKACLSDTFFAPISLLWTD